VPALDGGVTGVTVGITGRRRSAILHEVVNAEDIASIAVAIAPPRLHSPPSSVQVRNAAFSRVEPTPVEAPKLVAVSAPALALLELPASEAERPDFAAFFAGNTVLPGAQPAAHCYCGHQFGSFAGQLGDGATMYLGEVVRSDGTRVELQFKGAGKTPYSRTADGRKVLRSSIREFLCSELMAALGIPTTRAATIVTSDTLVARDIFYTGDVIEEQATIITRLAATFLRFGSFEIVKTADPMTGRAGPSAGNLALLTQLAEFTIRHYFPDIHAAHDNLADRAWAWYLEVVRRSAVLVAHWQAYGWCHGVLNTDNMSIVGLTIDYGPFGWMDRFDPEFICNNSDDQGRYSYENQVRGQWAWGGGDFELIRLCLPPHGAPLSVLHTCSRKRCAGIVASWLRFWRRCGAVRQVARHPAAIGRWPCRRCLTRRTWPPTATCLHASWGLSSEQPPLPHQPSALRAVAVVKARRPTTTR